MTQPLPFDPWTLGGVDDMIKDDLSFGLFATCKNPLCDKFEVRIRLDLHALIKRFGRDHPKADVLATCLLCRFAERDRTQTTICVGMKDENDLWRRAQKHTLRPSPLPLDKTMCLGKTFRLKGRTSK